MCRSSVGQEEIEGAAAERGTSLVRANKVFAVDELATPSSTQPTSPLANAFFIKAADPLYVSVGAMEDGGE